VKVDALSAVVPCYNAQATVTATLQSLSSGEVIPDEIICVDDASSDATASAIREFSHHAKTDVKLVSLPTNSGAAAARNRGAAAATGDLLLFIDADVIVGPQTLSAMRAQMNVSDAAAVVALYAPASSAGGILADFQSLLANSTFRDLDHHNLLYFGTQCVLLRRGHFLRANGFLESYQGATVEDLEFGFRLKTVGYRIALAASASIVHNRSYTFGSFTANYIHKARGLAALVRRLGPHSAGLGSGYSSWQNVVALGCLVAGICASVLAWVPALRLVALLVVIASAMILLCLWRGFVRDAFRFYGPRRMVLYIVLRAYVTLAGAVGALAGLVAR
jgi:GT2 family glycosyltransferase